MKPSEVSNSLRRIASKIDNSVNPQRSFISKDLRRVMAAMMTETERAIKADEDASRWHQGSGTHTSMCAGMAEQHEEFAAEGGPNAKKHQKAAKLWADAAEAEAALLRETQGEWYLEGEDDDAQTERWKASLSGQATDKAIAASKALGMDTSDFGE
jgi:hypothetical protein